MVRDLCVRFSLHLAIYTLLGILEIRTELEFAALAWNA